MRRPVLEAAGVALRKPLNPTPLRRARDLFLLTCVAGALLGADGSIASAQDSASVVAAAPDRDHAWLGLGLGVGSEDFAGSANLSYQHGVHLLLGDAPTPEAVGGDLRFGSIAVGQFHTCAISEDGGAYCWGGNWYGTLGQGSAGGDGGLMTLPSASAVEGGITFWQVTAGLSHTCALTPDGAAWCWGYGHAFGGGDSYVTTPVQVDGGLAFVAIGAGEASTCGLTAQGDAYCWGENSAGQLGDGTTGYRATPRAVTGGLHFTQLVVGAAHACGLTSDKHAYCWGINQFGQVGRTPSEVNP